MKKRSKILFLLLSLFVFIFSLKLDAGFQTENKSQPRVEIFDLAKISPGSTTEKILSDGRLDKVMFLNVHSEYFNKYEMLTSLKFSEIGPLTFGEGGDEGKSVCTSLADAIRGFKELKDSNDEWLEKQVPNYINKLKVKRDECESKNPTNRKDIIEANYIINNSRKTFEFYMRLKQGEQLTIKLRRDDKEWIFIFKYPRGKWLIYYGLCFVSKKLSGYDHYFLRENEVDPPDGYLLIQEPEPKLLDLEYIPTIFFTWMPFNRMSKSFSHGISGGLGTDMKSPTVFIGYSFVFSYNIGVNIGVIFHKQYQLKPQYSELDPKIVNSILSFEDLHRSVYRPNISIGIFFRFGSNPFKAMSEE